MVMENNMFKISLIILKKKSMFQESIVGVVTRMWASGAPLVAGQHTGF